MPKVDNFIYKSPYLARKIGLSTLGVPKGGPGFYKPSSANWAINGADGASTATVQALHGYHTGPQGLPVRGLHGYRGPTFEERK